MNAARVGRVRPVKLRSMSADLIHVSIGVSALTDHTDMSAGVYRGTLVSNFTQSIEYKNVGSNVSLHESKNFSKNISNRTLK